MQLKPLAVRLDLRLCALVVTAWHTHSSKELTPSFVGHNIPGSSDLLIKTTHCAKPNSWFSSQHEKVSFVGPKLITVFVFIANMCHIVKTLHTVSETQVYVDQTVNHFSLLTHKMHSVTTFSKIHEIFSNSYSTTFKTTYICSTFFKMLIHCFQNC